MEKREFKEIIMKELEMRGISMENMSQNIVNHNIDKLHESYQNQEMSISQATDIITHVAKLMNDIYSFVPRLHLKVCNLERNKEKLQNIIYKKFYDLALVPCMVEQNEEGMVRNGYIRNNILQTTGMTVNDFLDLAMSNAQKVNPAKVVAMADILEKMGICDECAEQLGFDFESMSEAGLYIVSTRMGINGAAAIFYPGVLNKLRAQFQSDFYLLPSSTEEFLVFPATENLEDTKNFRKMVYEVNREGAITPDIFLSDNVFFYDGISLRLAE